MINSFKKDLFSKHTISWKKINYVNHSKFLDIKKFFVAKNIGNPIFIRKRTGMNSNSQNFKVGLKKKALLLKKWSGKKK